MIGTLVSRYRVLRKLGEGGMGAVYEGVDEQLDRHVAIKVLHPERATDEEALSRFFKEARAVNLIKHPGLVQVFEFGHLPDKSAYLIMEYLEGQTLNSRWRANGRRMSEAATAQVAWQLSSALEATHLKGIVHRDLGI